MRAFNLVHGDAAGGFAAAIRADQRGIALSLADQRLASRRHSAPNRSFLRRLETLARLLAPPRAHGTGKRAGPPQRTPHPPSALLIKHECGR